MNKKVLVIDSDTVIGTQLTQYLSLEGFDVKTAEDGENGLKIALNQTFDAIILEILLPKCNGLHVLQVIREHITTPVIFLTARDDDVDKLLGLQMGADDYLLKPCDPAELIARLRAVLRRTSQSNSTSAKRCIEYPGIRVDCGRRLVVLENETLELTNTEFNILEILIKSARQAFSKEELTEYAIGRKFTAYDRSIDVHISNLRNKLGDNPDGEPWIKTVRGFGYLFNG
jgi:two-component system response regulator CpxR